MFWIISPKDEFFANAFLSKVQSRDPRPRTDWSRTKRFSPFKAPDRTRTNVILETWDWTGPGPQILRNPGPTLIRTGTKTKKILDQTEPGPTKFLKSRSNFVFRVNFESFRKYSRNSNFSNSRNQVWNLPTRSPAQQWFDRIIAPH